MHGVTDVDRANRFDCGAAWQAARRLATGAGRLPIGRRLTICPTGRHDFQSAFGTLPARALLRATGSIQSPEMANPPIYAPLRNTHRRPRYRSAAWKASSAMAAGVVSPNQIGRASCRERV